jgi:hypothetical protein
VAEATGVVAYRCGTEVAGLPGQCAGAPVVAEAGAGSGEGSIAVATLPWSISARWAVASRSGQPA